MDELREQIAELKNELATDEALLGQCFPNVFDGSLEWGAYDDKKEECGEIIKTVADELVEHFLTLVKDWFKEKIETLEVIGKRKYLQATADSSGVYYKDVFSEFGGLSNREYRIAQVAKKAQLKDSKDRLLEVMK